MDDNVTVLKPFRKTAKIRPPRSKPTLSPEIQSKIGDQLRTMYEDLKAEPIPDRFVELLKQLDKPQSGDR